VLGIGLVLGLAHFTFCHTSSTQKPASPHFTNNSVSLCFVNHNNTICNIYFAFVHPYILYGLEVYGNIYPSYLDKLTILNNKLLRILQKEGCICCNERLYLQYNTLPPVQLFNYQVLNLVHKVVYYPYLLLAIFHNYFTLTSSIHGYETRYNKLCLTHVNIGFGQRILIYKGSQLWNRLTSNLTNSTASKSFWKKNKIVVIL